MTEDYIKEVMRLASASAGISYEFGYSRCGPDTAGRFEQQIAHADSALEAYLRTIGTEPAQNTFPLNPNAASKWAHLQENYDAKAIGVVFRTGGRSVGSLVDGRVVWADWLAHPNGGKPKSVNAELLEALKKARHCIDFDRQNLIDLYSEIETGKIEPDSAMALEEYNGVIDAADAAIARAESAIETPAKVSPCAGHAVQQDADMRQIVGIKEAIEGVREFFDGEYHSGITGIVDASKVRGERVEDECRPEFDHCYVTQGGGGITGDDFHGTAYFHIGNGEYATVDY